MSPNCVVIAIKVEGSRESTIGIEESYSNEPEHLRDVEAAVGADSRLDGRDEDQN
jgi:hypothetical protein